MLCLEGQFYSIVWCYNDRTCDLSVWTSFVLRNVLNMGGLSASHQIMLKTHSTLHAHSNMLNIGKAFCFDKEIKQKSQNKTNNNKKELLWKWFPSFQSLLCTSSQVTENPYTEKAVWEHDLNSWKKKTKQKKITETQTNTQLKDSWYFFSALESLIKYELQSNIMAEASIPICHTLKKHRHGSNWWSSVSVLK